VVVGAAEEVEVEDDEVEAAAELVVVVLELLVEVLELVVVVLELVVEVLVELDVLELDVEHTGGEAVYKVE
jgi:hypothetical protein